MRFFAHAKYPFLEWRYRAYVATGLMLALGIGAMIFNGLGGRGWLNYGVDFTGGTIVQVHFNHPVHADEVRAAANAGGASDWEITQFGTDQEYVVRMRSFGQETGRDAQAKTTRVLSSKFTPQKDFVVARTEAVGPKAGAELQTNALIAVLLSFLAILGYLAIRFEWRFGLAAILATAHDILITLGFLAVTRTEIGLGTVAAVLTVVGYSMHDTIIVFDRIRENLARPRHGLTLMGLMDRSINETLPRTVLTAGTVLATLLALLIWGGPVIRPFAEVLFLGITIGTFSSIFVASPALHAIESKWPRKEDKSPTRSKSASRPPAQTAV
ncbi:MAG: Protein-export rane protein SecF [Gemmatimonadetes bacterium]|nr:Protein-export rane protein SecF [Gemmatimonadota bacterium]